MVTERQKVTLTRWLGTLRLQSQKPLLATLCFSERPPVLTALASSKTAWVDIGLRDARRGAVLATHTYPLCRARREQLCCRKPALAEFQIQEASIEKGETELEYRGAYHWGVPEATDTNPNANDLVQSHEFELQYSPTNWWLLQLTLGTEQPLHEEFEASDVEFETELLSSSGRVTASLCHSRADMRSPLMVKPMVLALVPSSNLRAESFLLRSILLFTDQVGPNRDTDGLGFDYGWRAEYDFAKHWGTGAEMFGSIEDLANAGSFNQQNHSIGPTLFWHPGDNEEESDKKEEGRCR